MQIVYARAEMTALVPTGRTITRDLNYFPEMKADWEARAGMWKRKGTDADVEAAKRALHGEGYTILTFPCGDRDCLARARDVVVAEARKRA